MTKQKRPPGGVGAGYVKAVSELYAHTTATPPIEQAICPNCGIEFSRAKREHWRRLCMNCWKWQTAHRHCKAAAGLLRGVSR